MTKIALITDGIWPYVMGGMQKHSYYLAKFLAAKGIFVQVYFTTKGEKLEAFEWDKYFNEEELEHLEFVEVKYPKAYYFPGHYIYESYLYSKNVLNAYKSNSQEPDIVYIQGFSGWALMKWFRKNHIKIPTLLNFHGLEMFQTPASRKHIFINATFRPFVRRNIKLANYSQSLGGKLTDILFKVLRNRERIVELGIGVSTEWLHTAEQLDTNKTIKFVFLGRYERRKGIEELSAVLKELIEEDKYQFEFEFIGPILEDKRLKYSNIQYHGLIREQSEIQAILQESDVLICPSYSEGMPTVILEAMASGCAIIASDVGAIRVQIDQDNGWLIKPANDQILKNAIVSAIEIEDEILSNMKKASIEKVKNNFLWSVIEDKHINVFKELIQENEFKRI